MYNFKLNGGTKIFQIKARFETCPRGSLTLISMTMVIGVGRRCSGQCTNSTHNAVEGFAADSQLQLRYTVHNSHGSR